MSMRHMFNGSIAAVIILGAALPSALAGNSGPINIGRPVDGNISDPGEVDVYDFTAPPGQIIFLDQTASSNPNGLNWKVEDQWGRVLLSNFAALNDLGPIALMGGDYTLSILSEGTGTGSYTFIVRNSTSDEDPIVFDTSYSGDISVPGQEDIYTFTASPGERLYLDLTAASNAAALNWRMEDANGRAIMGQLASLQDFGPFALVGGTYTLTVLGVGDATETYSFTMRTVAADQTTPIFIGTEYSGEISVPWDKDIYTFTAQTNQSIYLDLVSTSNPAGLNWILEDSHGRDIMSQTSDLNDGGRLALVGGAGNTYTLTVLAENSNTGTYTFKIWDVVDDPSVIIFDTSVLGDVSSPGQKDIYTFTAATHQRISLNLLLTSNPAGLNWILEDSHGRDIMPRTTSLTSAGPFTLMGGLYTLTVLGEGDQTGTYDFEILNLGTAPFTPRGDELITVDQEVSGFLDPDEVISYTFNVVEGDRLYFDLQDGAFYLWWTLLDPSGVTIFVPSQAFNTHNHDRGPYSLAAGIYTLTVGVSAAGGNESYQFTIWLVNDTTTNMMVGDSLLHTGFDMPGQTRMYTFDVTEGQGIFCDLVTGNVTFYWQLKDPVGQDVFGWQVASDPNGAGDKGPFILSTGTYSLIVNHLFDYVPGYAAQVEDVPQPTEDDIVFGQVVSGTFVAPGEIRTFTFDVAEGQKIYLDLQIGSSSLYWKLTDPVGHYVFDWQQAWFPNTQDRGPFTLTAGTYSLVLDPIGQGTPTYQFQFLDVIDESDKLALEMPETGVISGPIATASFTFSLSDGQSILFDVLANTSNLLWSLVDSVGVSAGLFVKANANNELSDDRGPMRLAGGSYTLVLEGVPFNAPDYDFVVREETLSPTCGELYYARWAGSPRIMKVEYIYDAQQETFTLGFKTVIADPSGADGLAFTPDGNLVIGGQGNVVYHVNLTTGELEEVTAGGARAYHIMLDPSGTKAWTGVPTVGANSLIAEIPLAPLADGTTHQPVDDMGAVVNITHIAFADGIAYCTISVPGSRFGSFGKIDLQTFVVTELMANMPAAHSVAFDPFTGHLMLMGHDHITQVDPDPVNPVIVSERVLPFGTDLDQGTVDGAGHLFAAAATTGEVVFLDYSSTGLVADPTNVERIVFLDTFLDDLAPLVGLGSSCQCSGSTRIISLQPQDGSSFPAGAQLTLSGQAEAGTPYRPVVAVLVNGASVDSMDSSGRFFKTVTIAEGDNLFAIEAFDECGSSQTVLHLTGVPEGAVQFDEYADVTLQMQAEYLNTTYNDFTQSMVFEAKACNQGAALVDFPIIMVIQSITEPSVTVETPDGFTPDGDPYFLFDHDPAQPGYLQQSECSDAHTLSFHNPEQVPVSFTVTWLAPQNSPPYFTTVPVTDVVLGAAYAYPANAEDPDGHPVTYELQAGPNFMTIDTANGTVDWTPAAPDVGTHDVIIVASDDRGGSTSQGFALSVAASAPLNQAPFFTSSPITHAAVGVAYEYQAAAFDPDQNPTLTYSKIVTGLPCELKDPSQIIVDSNGLVHWAFALPGDCTIGIHVTDGLGGEAEQIYVLTVGTQPTNPSAPLLFGTPPATAVVDNLYMYQPVANDPDPMDTLTFSPTAFPVGMIIDPATGRITWIPDDTQVTVHPVEFSVSDGNGASASQAWDLTVSLDPVNRVPVFDSTPSFIAVVGVPYDYVAHAMDPDGEIVTYTLVAPPVNAMIDPVTGVLMWDPAVVGPETIAIKATDPNGAFGSQVFEIDVHPINQPPTFTSTPGLNAAVGQIYRYDADANDLPDVDLLTYSLINAPALPPAGMTIDPATGLILWTPDDTQVAMHQIKVRVADLYGGEAEQPFTIDVIIDSEAPEVQIVFSQEPAPVSGPIQICVQASDDIGVVSRTLTLDLDPMNSNPMPLALDAFGCAVYTFSETGTVEFAATAVDASNNVGMASRNLDVVDPEELLPDVSIPLPAPGTIITAPVEIVASITSVVKGIPIRDWTVSIQRFGSEEWTEIKMGRGEVSPAAPLVTFDPTMLPNDSYKVRIVATDENDSTGGIVYQYHVAGDYKLGNFVTTFTDVVIPVAGIPMVITREYNSLDTSMGDFGPGWRLGLPGQVSDNAVESMTGDPFFDMLASEPYSGSTRVYVTRPDGRRVGFTFSPQSLGPPFPFLWFPIFEPDPGVNDTLEAKSALHPEIPLEHVWSFDGLTYSEFIIPFNPREFIFTTAQGVKYTIDEFDGLLEIEDANLNTITVSPTGMVSSTGVALIFERDEQNRITKIIEPDPDPADGIPPGELMYVYDDITGDLSEFWTQTNDPPTTYFYLNDPMRPHYLERIEDPLNRPVIRTYFDSEGRIRAQCGADVVLPTPPDYPGCTTFDPDVVAGLLTIVNARGYQVDLLFDDQGNVLFEKRYLTIPADLEIYLETAYQYDADNNLEMIIDPEGNGTTLTYDDRGNMLSRTDASDERTWTWTYNDCNKVLTVCDPLDNCTTNTYYSDNDCDLQFAEDALGNVTEYTYNLEGQLTDVVTPVDTPALHWQISYDSIGLPDGITDALGHTTVFHFNSVGELEYRIDRNGRRIDFEYDEAHRVERVEWDTDPPTVSDFVYDAAGNKTSATNPDSSLTVQFWNTGHIKSIAHAATPNVPPVLVTYGYWNGPTLMSGYDGNGNLTHTMIDINGVTDNITQYDYDALDRLTTIQQSGTNVNEKLVDISYFPSSQVDRITRYWDLARTQEVANTTYGYDCGGCPSRLTSIHHRKEDTTPIHLLDFIRDDVGNITKMTEVPPAGGSLVHDYTYDGLRRLLTATHPVAGVQPDEYYGYDEVGNRLSSHLSPIGGYLYSYMSPQYGEGGNQLRLDDDFDYLYDANGNLTLMTKLSNLDYTTFEYDHRDLLTRIVAKDVNNDELYSADYTYDILNERIRTVENGVQRGYAYDDGNAVMVFDDSGQLLKRRLYYGSLDSVVAEDVGAGVRWFLADQLGTPIVLVDNAAMVLAEYTYDSFGQLLSPLDDNELRFTAREFSDLTGLGYYRFRYYNPSIGRFIQDDPISPFAYDYVSNNPLVYIDPLGLQEIAETGLTATSQRLYVCTNVVVFQILTSLVMAQYGAAAGEAIGGVISTVAKGFCPNKPDVSLITKSGATVKAAAKTGFKGLPGKVGKITGASQRSGKNLDYLGRPIGGYRGTIAPIILIGIGRRRSSSRKRGRIGNQRLTNQMRVRIQRLRSWVTSRMRLTGFSRVPKPYEQKANMNARPPNVPRLWTLPQITKEL